MRIFKFIFIAACLFSLAACVSGGSEEPSVNDDVRIMSSMAVPESGTAVYTGTGEFEGFSVSVSDPALAGRTIYFEKMEADYNIDGYVAVSDIYAVRLTNVARAEEFFTAEITLPYNASRLALEGGAAGDVVLCSVDGNSAEANATQAGQGTYVTSAVVFPKQFFAGFKGSSAEIKDSGLITIKGVSYADAADVLIDPSGTAHPDVVRGIRFIQPGEKVILGINKEAFGETVASHAWEMKSAPAGSASALTASGADVSFIADRTGMYDVELSLTGAYGTQKTETLSVVAQNYSNVASPDKALCLIACHDGSNTSSVEGKYGKRLFRDLVTSWTASAHGSAFASVATETSDSSCFKCHATGFLFADRDSDLADEHSSVEGYDDTITDWNLGTNAGAGSLRNVTCEACHGPSLGGGDTFMDSHYSATPITSEVCMSCHDHGGFDNSHTIDYSAGHDTAHKLADGNVAKNANCFKCHTGQGAMAKIYSTGVTPANTDTVTGITCAVCHDPHAEEGFNASLRLSGNVELVMASGTYTVDAGDGRICYNCHTADAQLPAVGTVPHNSQAEMVNGLGGYTYGQTDVSDVTYHVENGMQCSDCHMTKESRVTHDFDMTSDPALRLEECSTRCHNLVGAVVYTDGHYDFRGVLAPVRAKIEQLKAKINETAGLSADTAVKAFYTADSEAAATALNRAAYNYNFIMADRSYGLHNSVYTTRLIDLSLADLENYATGE